jgi:hypothetical protein
MIRPQLLAIRVGDEHDSEDSSVLVDIAQVRVQILAPQIDFFELVVEDIDTFSLQRFGYAAVLIWIQLWPPLYAILNYMASIYAAYDLAAAADLGTGGKSLALQTASTIYSRAISEIVKTDDGTLASKKSLLVQSGKQVGKDAGATIENAKDVVKDLLRK